MVVRCRLSGPIRRRRTAVRRPAEVEVEVEVGVEVGVNLLQPCRWD